MGALQSIGVGGRPEMEGRWAARAALSAEERGAMFELLCEHFEGISAEVFEMDLAGKDWVVLLEEAGGRLRGFSTFAMYETIGPAGERAAVVYSGDTIVDRGAWGTAVLPRSWIHAVYEVHRTRFAGTRLYWLLITSGFRTYRFLPVFWREFYPRFDATTPAVMRNWMERIAAERFGGAYERESGIVRFANPQRLRGGLREIPEEKMGDPHVAFFAEKNPGHVHGDELVCAANLSPANLTAAGRRMVYGGRGAAGEGG